MRCEVHCPPDSGGAAVAAFLVVAATAVVAVSVAAAAWQVLGAVLPAVTGTILGACAAGVVVVRHLVLYGRARKPRPRPVAPPRMRAQPQLAIEAGRRALEAAPRAGVTVTLTAGDHAERVRAGYEGLHRH